MSIAAEPSSLPGSTIPSNSAEIADMLDGKGLPHATHLDQLRPLLAQWIERRERGEKQSPEVESQYRHLVCNALRLTRRDGTQVFAEESAVRDREGIDLLAAAVAATGRKPCGRRVAKNLRLPRPVKPAFHSEWATVAMLRPDWSRSAPRLTVLYPGASCRVELAVGKDVLWSGEWTADLQIDGHPVLPSPGEEWVNTCWVSDADGDYLELEIGLEENLRIQRHFFLARKEGFLLMADAVLGSRRAALDYRGTLPLGRRATFRTSCCETCKTKKTMLWGQKSPRAAVIPLALSERHTQESPADSVILSAAKNLAGVEEKTEILRCAQNDDSCAQNDGIPQEILPGLCALQSSDGLLELRQSAEGSSLFAPLFFDLDRRRFDRPLIHRRLTVAESMKVQPADVAVGYRVARGRRQWLLYRSLTPPKNRTLLGHNLSSEMLIARFTPKGEVETLIEIE